MRLTRHQNLRRRPERNQRLQNHAHVVAVPSDARGELTVRPRPRAALAVAQVAVRVEHAAREEGADVATAAFNRLPALKHRHRDPSLRQRECREEPRGAETHDHDPFVVIR